MTDFSDFKAQIAEWANRADWDDVLTTSYIRQAEEKFNAELRIDRMLKFYEALITSRCAPVPDDLVQLDLVKVANANGADGYLPWRYKSRDEFFNLRDNWTFGYYTMEGRQIFFGGSPDDINGTNIKIVYYAEVPVFSDIINSWVYTKYPSLYLDTALSFAALHATGEEDQAANFKALSEDKIAKLNAAWLRAKAAGSRITRTRVRTFG